MEIAKNGNDPVIDEILSKADAESREAAEKVEIRVDPAFDEDDEDLILGAYTAKDAVFGLTVTRASEDEAIDDLKEQLVRIFFENSEKRREVLGR